ncbi:PH domain-containing protein [Microbacterium sp. SLBN-146]|uniref:PH domain-containing protein n=1 Tax=Microbacterium sp. SLBN-146 TaxID=2768457 RepID=UPI00115135CA|nr:PH domain-containing protein [Microbacterium sp. SLBN-146]TQJ31738.1 PH (Pleckstrin Homology) domain-containing protein [Microbacterium sp. SLBN-146]
MPEPVVFRPRGGQILAWIAIASCAAGLVFMAVTDGVASLLAWAWPLVLAAWLAWLLYVRPYVSVTEGFAEIGNPFRTHRVPWGDIDRVDTRYALTIHTRDGRRIRAWAAPAPGARRALSTRREEVAGTPGEGETRRPSDAAGTESGDSATLVLRHLEEYRRAAGPALAGGTATTLGVLHIGVTAVLIAAAVLSIALLPHG